MNILIVRTVPGEIKYSLGTYNEQYIGLARALVAKGHHCDIICSSDDGKEKVKIIPTESGIDIKLYCVKATIILKNAILHFDPGMFDSYDVIQAIEYNQIYTWYLASKCKGKYIVYHGPYYSSFNRRYNLMARFFDMFFLRRYIKNNTAFITKSKMAERYLKDKGITNVSSVGVGLDIKSLEPNRNSVMHSELEDKMLRTDSTCMLLYIGRIEPRRNTLFLLDVLKELRDRGNNTYLTIVGKGPDEYVNTFFTRVSEYGLDDYVLYESILEQKYLVEIYKKADIFLLPTRYDIYGMVLLESMYYGLPTISSPCGGAEMMINSWNNGVIINDFNAHTWSDTVIKIMEEKDAINTMGSLATKTIVDGFTWDAISDRILENYYHVIGK